MNHLQSYSTPPRRHTRFLPTDRFSERKRALFPSLNKDNDSDSDIGHMSPLELSSSPDRYESPFSSPHIAEIFSDKNHKPFSNKEIFNTLFENITPIKSKVNKENEDILAPNTPSPVDSPEKDNTTLIIPETPTKVSPTHELKTPHESSNSNLQLPKLIRKSLGDLSNLDKSSLKRKPDSLENSPCNKSLKLDISLNKISKARTALFPENIFPAKSFYPKSIEDYKPGKYVFSEPLYKAKKSTRKTHTMYLCSRKRISKNLCGQINAGVRHGIKKPKHKPKLSKTQIFNAAMNILDKSPLNNVLDNVNNEQKGNKENLIEKNKENECRLSSEQVLAMDSILKNISTNANTIKAKALTVLNNPSIIENLKHVERTNEKSPTVKRPLSPQPEQNRKFFKGSRTNATVTINKNIKLRIDNGEMSLLEKQKRKITKFLELSFDASDLTLCEDERLTDNSFTDILKSLEDDNIIEPIPNENTNSIILTAHNSVSASDNSIQLHTEPAKKTDVTEMLLSPTTLMCDMTSGLALNSPKNQTVLEQSSLDNVSKKCLSFPDNMAVSKDSDKLFPIFYPNQTSSSPNMGEKKECQAVQNLRKMWKPMTEDQMLIDAGQKKFGHIQCAECKLVYHIGDPDDEIMHHNYHNSINVLKFSGWKSERVVNQFVNGRVILIQPGDPKTWWRKVKDVLTVVNRELGFVDINFDDSHCKIYLYIKNKQIQGCLVTEPKTDGYKMLPFNGVDCCTEESFPVKCGVSRLWVSQEHRKQGVATSLMNVMRCNYMYGYVLKENEIAFSAPTESGKAFATKYMKTDEFMVYMS